jgi:hypothetical protein
MADRLCQKGCLGGDRSTHRYQMLDLRKGQRTASARRLNVRVTSVLLDKESSEDKTHTLSEH